MMLIDFSEILQTNVYVLGQTVMSVRSKLATELPVIDPVHYIERFATRLSLGAKTQMVCNTAMQVVRRLSRDWLQTGRRPSGITGVALYIAAHMHGLNPSMADLVKEMHICDSTLRKRLVEFLDTPAAELPRTDFETVAEQEFDNVLPPVMKSQRSAKDAGDLEPDLVDDATHSDNSDNNDDGDDEGSDDDDVVSDDDDNDDDDDDDDDDRDDKIDGKKRARSSSSKSNAPPTTRRRLRKRSPSPESAKREMDDSSDSATEYEDADTMPQRRSSRIRHTTQTSKKASVVGVSLPAPSVDSAELGQVMRLPIDQVRHELTRRGRTALPADDADARHALFADNVDRQSLLTSLTVADLRALAENREANAGAVAVDAGAVAADAGAVAADAGAAAADAGAAAPGDAKSASTLPRDEQRRLLDAAQRMLRETIQRDLIAMHQSRKENKVREEQEALKLAEERRVQAAQRDAALTSVAAASSGSQRQTTNASGRKSATQLSQAADDPSAASTTAVEVPVVEAIEGDDVASEEINGYLLTPAEVRLRSDIWHEMNKEYLDEQRAKQESEEQLRAQGKPPRKRTNRRSSHAVSASEAAHEALGKTSSKINYAVLQQLLDAKSMFPKKK
jgi:hypothetical protein